jgi:ATP-dependent 26S proteasome regulatory subunit
MKIFELSKELNIENKELIKIALDLGIEAKSHLSVLTDEQVQLIKDSVEGNATKEQSQESEEEVKTEKVVQQKQNIKPMWKPDLTRQICIKNISRGKLIYKSKRQIGYTVEWAKKGDTNYLELGEFINLKNSDRRFITEPWIRIVEEDEIEILQYANVLQYYKEILGIDNTADILKLNFESFKKKFDRLPEGYKNAVVEQAADMIKNGELDSIKIKNYIEQSMGIELDVLIQPEKKQSNKFIDIK